jgi:hypothetical protein
VGTVRSLILFLELVKKKVSKVPHITPTRVPGARWRRIAVTW